MRLSITFLILCFSLLPLLVSADSDPIPQVGYVLSAPPSPPPPPWTMMGETQPTVLDCNNCFQLTTEGPSQAGCLWDDETVDLGGPLDFTVKMFFGDSDAGADGICLVFAASPDCGMYGADIGAGGIPNSVIFEFDTWDNGSGYGDLPNDHVSMDINGVMSTPLFGPSDLGNIEDGGTHMVRFVWDGAGGFQIFFDGALVLSGNYDFTSVIGGSEAFLGFTASTGGAWNNQIVCPEDDPVGPPDPATFIESDLSVCANEKGVIYAVDPISGVTYQWTAPPGATINGTGASVTIDWGTEGGDVCVELDNGCGTSDPVCVTVEVTPIPEAQVDPLGVICDQEFDLNDLVIFNLQPGETFTFHPDENAAEAGTPDMGNPPIVNASGTYWIRVEAGDGCYQLIPVVIEMEWLDLFVVQPDPLCAPGSLDLSLIDVIDLNGNLLTGFGYYPTQIDAEDQTNPLSSSIVTATGSYWVRAETFNGCYAVAEILVEFLPPPDISLVPPPVQCAVDSFDLSAIDIQELSGLPPNSYTITFHATALAAVSGMPAIDPPIVNQPGTYWVRMTNLAGCFDTLSFALTFLETPSVFLSGGEAICEGDGAELTFQFGGVPPFSVTYTDGVDTFTISGSLNPLVQIHLPDQSVSYSILSFSDQTPPGCPPASGGIATFTVTPELKASPVIKVCDQNQYVVTFTLIGGDSTSWQVGGNAGTLISDTFVSDPIVSGVPYSFMVWDSSGCDTLFLSGSQNCDCLTDAGNLVETKADICLTDTLLLTFSGNGFLDPDDIRQFVLHDGSGTILQAIHAWNDQPVFVFDPSTMMAEVTYYVSPIAGNMSGGVVDTMDICLSVTPGIPVIFHGPPTFNVPHSDTICSKPTYSLPLVFGGSLPFTLTYQVNGGATQQMTWLNPVATLSIPGLNSSTVQWLTLSDAFCSVDLQDSFTLVVNKGPTVTGINFNCNGTNTEYTISFQIIGGDSGSYTVSGPGALTGNVFTSQPIPAGSAYSFVVSDQFNCKPFQVSGTYDCLCLTNAGSLSGAPLNICVGDTLGFLGAGTFLDSDDTLVYWLVADLADPAGTLLWQTNIKQLFYPGLPVQTGTIYYLVAIAGNAGSTGGIDTTDACLDWSNGLPVSFIESPQIEDILPSPTSQFSCQDSVITLTAMTSPQNGLVYTWSASGGGLVPPLNQAMVQTNASGWYTLTIVETVAGCQDSAGIYLAASQDVPQVTILPPATLNCLQSEVTLDATGSSSGTGFVLQWSTADGQIQSGGNSLFPTVNLPGTYQLSILDEKSLCLSTSSILVYQDTMAPVADAGVDKLIPCGQALPVLSGSNSSGQGNLSFHWSTVDGAIVTPPDQMDILPADPGHYLLTVVDPVNGCTDTDEVALIYTGGLSVDEISIDPPLCFGEATGQIDIQAVIGGQAPFMAMVGSASFPVPGVISGLTGGQYAIQITDAFGCSWDSTLTIDEPPVLLIDLGVDLTVEYGASVVVVPDLKSIGAGGVSYEWSDQDSILCLGCPQLTITPATNRLITLKVTDQNGCIAEAVVEIRVIIRRRVYIPNSFSPNFDGINDIFSVHGGDVVERVQTMAIFDRWGNDLFQVKDISADGIAGWDGMYRGKPMDPGVYVYVVEIAFKDGSVRLYKGDVQIMK
ncbi:MAG: gliding motility-associated C-terminal domain-containing protein [Saprospiraceae bacterium]|nr:gliding motility-associated C-terminal domain-containing protein [Saprospiraceae bacterium]